MKALLAKQKMINKVILIPEYKIKPNPYQPRKVFDDEKIDQLATSIAQYGLLQPITVLPMEDGNYQLVAGERRLLACRKLRMQEVPAILTSMDEERSSALALIENIQRCDLNYFEEAMAIQKLMKMVGHTQQAVAKKLGKNQSTIANKLRLLQFSEEVREAILAANLTERHARALLNLNEQGDEVLLKAVKEISEKEMNVSQTEKYIAQLENVRIKGLMTIAPFVENPEDNRQYFRNIRQLSVDIAAKNIDNVSMNVLSMGMTGDYMVAIEEGATMVRVGTGIFGERNYNK